MAFRNGSSEIHEIAITLINNLDRYGAACPKRILFVTKGRSGLLKALRENFGEKLVPQRYATHKSPNVQGHVAKRRRKNVHGRFTTALAQTRDPEASTSSAGAGEVAEDQKRVSRGFAPESLGGAVSATSAEGAGALAQKVNVNAPDRDHARTGLAQRSEK